MDVDPIYINKWIAENSAAADRHNEFGSIILLFCLLTSVSVQFIP